MSLPQLLARIAIQGSRILGKAFLEAGRQAGRNFKAVPAEGSAASTSSSNNPSGSKSDQITRTHRMTLEEARMILNFKPAEGEELDKLKERVLKTYEQLFKINAPPAPKGKTGGGSGSFYIQSKIVRAKERIEAEWAEEAAKGAEGKEGPPTGTGQGGDGQAPPPPTQ